MNAIKQFLILILVCLVSACGGNAGDITSLSIDQKSLSIDTSQNQASSPQRIKVQFKGDSLAAGPTPGMSLPNWLVLDQLSKTANSAEFQVFVNNYAPVGSFTTSIRFSTIVGSGEQFKSVDLPIKVNVLPQISIVTAEYSGSFTYGSPIVAETYQAAISGAGIPWTAASDQSWLKVLTPTGLGDATVSTKIDTSGLSAGSYKASLTVQHKDFPNNAAKLTYSVTIQNPTLSVVQPEIVLGGTDGLSPYEVKDLSFSINTGASSHPFTIKFKTDDGKPWVQTSGASGVVNANGASVKISANAVGLAAGAHTGKAIIEVNVGSLKLNCEIPVVFNREASRIVASTNGVAFSYLKNRSVLSRDVKIFSSIGRTDIPWKATSDQPWLNVTPSGVTGAAVTLTANPASLAPGKLYFANVLITANDSGVENQESILVGFTVSSLSSTETYIETPKTDSSASYATTRPFITASPVEPLVFTNIDETTIKAFNIYTGAEERSFSNIVAKVGAMTMSGDGRLLYVFDQINLSVAELNAQTGARLQTYSASGLSEYQNQGLAYLRPGGRPILVGAGSHVYDLTTHEEITLLEAPPYGESLSVGVDPSTVVDVHGGLYQFVKSTLGDGKWHNKMLGYQLNSAPVPGQACMNADGSIIYTAAGAPYEFPGYSVATKQVVQILPGDHYPNSIVCAWNGVVVGGSSSYYEAIDIFVYDGKTGVSLRKLSSTTSNSYRYLANRGLAVSGDASRLISIGEDYRSNQIWFRDLPSPSQ
ncbi:MAG TPA: hypothetical protein VIZ65_01825 [Cellvibrionaceae bacterium]